MLTAAYAGCRWGELVGLRRKNLDLAKGTLTVVEQVVELRGGQLLTRELKGHVAQFVGPGPDAVVFPSRTGGVLRQGNFGTATGFRRCGVRRTGQAARP